MNALKGCRKRNTLILLLVGMCLMPPVMGKSDLSDKSLLLLQQMQDNIKNTLLSISEIETSKGNDMADFYYQLSLPQHETVQLGMVMDIPDNEDGFKVLSVSANGLAEKLGIKTGDVIKKLNESAITKESYQDVFTELKQLKHNQKIELSIERANKNKVIQGRVDSLTVPSVVLISGIQLATAKVDRTSNCGRVSVFDLPRGGSNLFSATFHRVGDRNVMSRRETSYKLPPGKHVIYVKEKIVGEQLDRSRKGKAKGIEINIEAGKEYSLAARYIPENKMKIFKAEYWEPTLWQVSSKSCVL